MDKRNRVQWSREGKITQVLVTLLILPFKANAPNLEIDQRQRFCFPLSFFL